MDWAPMKKIINECASFAIIPHKNPDGDAIGSSLALARGLKNAGKDASIFLSGDFPKNLSFIWTDEFAPKEKSNFDAVIMVDCADETRADKNETELFFNCENTVVIDHHVTNPGFGKYNFIDSGAAATGEIIFDLIENMTEFDIDEKIASYLYCAILCDTGSFKYSNTTSETHIIAAKLLKYGIDTNKFSREAFDKKSIRQYKLMSEAIKNLEILCGGKAALSYVTYNYLKEMSMSFDEADFLVSLPRDIEGVEVGIFLKVRSENEIKVSFRSNYYADVALLASEFGGGGHARAAGCTILNKSIDEFKNIIAERLEQVLNV